MLIQALTATEELPAPRTKDDIPQFPVALLAVAKWRHRPSRLWSAFLCSKFNAMSNDSSGLGVGRSVREMPQLRDTALIAQTGWSQQENRRQSEEAEFNV
jgi:hypothetical protein